MVQDFAYTDGYSGLGDLNPAGVIASSGGLVSAGTAVGVATGAIASGSALASFGALAGPIGAIAGTLVGLLTQVFSGCGQSCVQTSNFANQIEPVLLQNVQAYLASGRTKSEQAAALANFDYVWSKLQAFCGSGQWGTAGQRCITDRQRGACVWKASPSGWAKDSAGVWQYTAAGSAGSGTACWNWFVGYRDPIANDPDVKPDTSVSSTVASTVADVLGISSGNYTPVLIGLAAILILVVAVGE